jgi:hypothetical protein
MENLDAATMELAQRLSKDLRDASRMVSEAEARFLVDLYYRVQKFRVNTSNAVKQIGRSKTDEPADVLKFFLGQEQTFEAMIKDSLTRYVKANNKGSALLSAYGIGPIITAGFLAHVDMSKSPTAGSLLRFAGQDPDIVWSKGQKRPWNNRLKVLCFHSGNSFIKFKANKNDMYGRLFDPRRNYEIERNENGELAPQAKAKLEKFNISKSTAAYHWYSQGKLPPGHINARVRRWIVRHFVSHIHDVWYFMDNGEFCPHPYMSIMNRAHTAWGISPWGPKSYLEQKERPVHNLCKNETYETRTLYPMPWNDYVKHIQDLYGAVNKYPDYAVEDEIAESDEAE